MTNRFQTALSILLTAFILSGCTQNATKTDNSSSAKAPGATTASTATGADPGSNAVLTTTVTDTTSSAGTDRPGGKPDVITKTLPNGQKQVSINMSELPNETVICTIGGSPLRVGTYKSMLTLQQVQASAGIGQDPATRARLLAEAQIRGITLSDGEKERLLKTARAAQSKDAAGFQEFLKAKGLTEAQYAQEIYNIGLAYKASSILLQQGLLPELVNREILVNAAKAGGLEKDAMNKYFLIKHSRQYPLMVQQTGLPHEALKDEIVKGELAKLQVKRLTKDMQVTDSEIKQFYDLNKSAYQHGERIRVSSILILAPSQDALPAIKSIRTQIKEEMPNLTDAEVEAKVKQVDAEREQRALLILGKAKVSKDFKTIANENTDDMQVKMRGTGGDLGWIEKSALTPEVAEAIWNLKPGTVLPRLIKTEVGYQILKVTGREKPGILSYNEVKPVLALQVEQQKTQQLVNNWLAQKLKTVKIEYSPKFVALAGDALPKLR